VHPTDIGDEMSAAAALEGGRTMLAPLLEANGFDYEPGTLTTGDAQEVARGAFVRGDGRRLELGVVRLHAADGAGEGTSPRADLREVVYRVGALSVAHEAYMAVVLGEEGSNQYPSFGGHPLDGFRHLRHDLECYTAVFLRGPEAHFRTIAERAALWSRGMWSPRALFRT
jgi:hypothetical protein